MTSPFLSVLLMTFMVISSIPVYAQMITWKPLVTGAGGWVTGMDIHPSGNPIYVRVDVGSAYRYDPATNTWINIVTATTLPATEVYWNNYHGVLSICAAPADSNLVYMAYADGIFKSTDQGNNWMKTNFPSIEMSANDDESKLSGERLAIDPNNSNVVYFGSINHGLWQTTDGGNTWTPQMTVPSGQQERGVRQVLFDASAGLQNGRTATIYATVDSVGLFQSVDAGATWTNVSVGNLPANPIFLDANIDQQGLLYVLGYDANTNASFGVYRYNGQTWQQVLSTNRSLLNIAIDPFDRNRAFAFSEGFSDIYRTTNLLSSTPTWDNPSYTKSATNIPWLSWAQGNWFTLGEVEFDPAQPGRIWLTDGVGTWQINNLTSNTLLWEEQSAGQEHLVSNDLVVNASGQAVTAHWDRPLFLHNNVDVAPQIHQPSSRFNSAWDIDVLPTDPNFLAAIIEDHRYCCYDAEHRRSGYSLDGGQTWQVFASQPEPSNANAIYGNIAVSANNAANLVWLPTNNRAPYYTQDTGTTWQQVTLPNNNGNCCLNFHFVYKKALTADRVIGGKFYIYNWENGSIYVSTNGGQSWQEETALQDYYGWNAKIMAAPNHANHLWFSHGGEQSIALMQPLKRSTDAGQTWQTISNTSEVINMAIGAPLTVGAYPTIFIQGRVNGVMGYWMSGDEGATWLSMGTYPLGIYDIAKVMEGDPYIPTRLYVGYSGNGFVYGQDDQLVLSNSKQPVAEPTVLKVYPNPVQEQLLIASNRKVEEVAIYNAMGQCLHQATYRGQAIEVATWPSGIYWVKAGGQWTSFVKQ